MSDIAGPRLQRDRTDLHLLRVPDVLDFAHPIKAVTQRFDLRSDDELRRVISDDVSPIERERALWEYADRHGNDATDLVAQRAASDPDRAIRNNALWLLQRIAGSDAASLLTRWTSHDDPEAADWSRVLVQELSGSVAQPVYTTAQVHEDRTFDQTLPLVISGYADVHIPAIGRTKAVLSPLWFESVMGRVMACTNAESVMTDLVIEKDLSGLHPDGSHHFEIFKFRGFSDPVSPQLFEHRYESLMIRRFYPSGIVEQGPATFIPVELLRGALTDFAVQGEYAIEGDGARAEKLRSLPMPFVRSVRGRFMGWAAVNVERVIEAGTVRAGDVQLSSPTDATAGPMTNVRLYGTFRGKIADHTGNGVLDINTIPCHGTIDGRHDLYADGSCVDDPYAASEAGARPAEVRR